MTGHRISVVVPFYNNAGLLADCLASIAAQTYAGLEVIMVDDGSADASADAARAMAAADPRFRLVSVPNGGPGWARNHGIAAASGEFLAFVDADDLLPPGAYATMLAVLDRSGSDFLSGGVMRLDAAGLGRSGLHARAIKARRIGTHISRTPELFYDISVWNKLFRRSFWDAAGLSFPEGMVWEDLVAMTKAHVLASAVDVITDPVYHWRDRDRDAPSITQSRADLRNIRDRITALTMIDDFLRSRGTPAMLRQHQHKALVNDLWLYVGDLPAAGEEYQREYTALAAGYLAQVTPGVTADLPASRKLAYHLITRGRTAELAEFARWLADNPGRTPPMVRARGRLTADLPLRDRRDLAIPASVFRPRWRELDPYVGVEAISWQGGALRIEGWAHLPSVDISRRRHASKLLVLVPRGRRRPPIVLPARSLRRPDVTAASGQERYSYDWAGFRCEVGAGLLRAGRRWLAGTWDAYLLVRGRTSWRAARLHVAGPLPADPGTREVAPGLTLGVGWTGGRLELKLRPKPPPPPPPPPPPVPAPPPTCRSNGTSPPMVPHQRHIAADTATAGAAPGSAGQSWGADGALVLRGRLRDGGGDGVGAGDAGDGRDAGGAGDGGGGGDGGAGGCEVVLRLLDGWDTRVLAVDERDGAFEAVVPVAAMDTFGDRRPLRDGHWEVTVSGAGGRAVSGWVTADPTPVRTGPKVYRATVAGAGLLLEVGPALGVTERGRLRRLALREVYYRAQRLLPVRDQILLSSFHGKQCGDSPRAVAAELRRRGDRRKHIWAVSDWSVAVPGDAAAVLTGTRPYFAALARSRFLVVNDHLPLPYRKRRGQRHAQTWHGTPLKRIGYDIGEPKMASGRRYLEYMAGDVAQWDLLLSPNPFSTPIMRRAFRFGGQISETGYPRNDALAAAAAAERSGGEAGQAGAAAAQARRAAEIRRRVGVPGGKRVAMYVPTWRDDKHDAAGRYLLDFRLDLAAAARRLGADWVLLIRGHHLMAGGLPAALARGGNLGQQHPFAIDVTGYPDIGDLLAVTDVLVTDYSSVMFDFAPAGRPMLFFTYDLEQYRDHLRGFYFDFTGSAPGPLLQTSDEVIDALADIDAVAAKHAAALAAFTARFCPLDDGNASARACDAIFGAGR